MPEGAKVDMDFMVSLENHDLKGYVPTNTDGTAIGQSGVTVSSGVDIGQRSAEDLKKLGLTEYHDLYWKLLPYTEKRKENAIAALKEKPLEITAEEAA